MKIFSIVSTTSKHSTPFMRLPNRNIKGMQTENVLISNEEILKEYISKLSDSNIIVADCEKKQNFSIYDTLIDSTSDTKVIDYKPNDLTMEAADLTVLNFFNRDISSKSIAIYGTGNIAFKLALRLSERNANVHIYGRNENKVRVCVEALKQTTFDETLIHYGDFSTKVDCLLSFVSANQIISEKGLLILNDNSLCVDGGIGNFSKKFIKTALENGHEVRRLDVRQSQEIMDGYINSRLNSEFDNIIGTDVINGEIVVAGGIMGRDGEIIIDRISKPNQVLGVANGIGGIKNDSELSDEEKEKIKKIQETIEQNLKKSVGR